MAAAVRILLLLGLLSALPGCSAEPPPVLGTLPAFELTSEAGQPFGSAELEGSVWVANFIFTRCPTICPAFTAKMAQVAQRSRDWKRPLQLVSFSVDPDYDTPPRLKEYGERYDADFSRWRFLTGSLETIKLTVTHGMKVGMGRGADPDDIASIFHGTYFVLVDAKQRIRGYYDFNGDSAIDDILKDARRVQSQAKAAGGEGS